MDELKEKNRLLAYTEEGGKYTRNSMGCYEGWYDCYFAINKVFSKKEIEEMSDKEISDLEKLANGIADGLY